MVQENHILGISPAMCGWLEMEKNDAKCYQVCYSTGHYEAVLNDTIIQSWVWAEWYTYIKFLEN